MEYEIKSTAEYIECLKDLSKNGIDGYRNEKTNLYYRGEPEDYGKTAGLPGILLTSAKHIIHRRFFHLLFFSLLYLMLSQPIIQICNLLLYFLSLFHFFFNAHLFI